MSVSVIFIIIVWNLIKYVVWNLIKVLIQSTVFLFSLLSEYNSSNRVDQFANNLFFDYIGD